MFSIMNTPLSGLLDTSGNDARNGPHPLADLKKSMSKLSSQSFVPGKSGLAAMPVTLSMEQLMKSKGQPREMIYCQHCNGNYAPCGNKCGNCNRPVAVAQQHKAQALPILKDNGKFMMTDGLLVTESSTVTALELIKDHVHDLSSITTSTEKVTEETLRKLIAFSLLGMKDVLTQVFTDAGSSDQESNGVSDGSFERVDQPEFWRCMQQTCRE